MVISIRILVNRIFNVESFTVKIVHLMSMNHGVKFIEKFKQSKIMSGR